MPRYESKLSGWALRLEECPRFVQVLPFCNRDTMGRRRSFHARNLAPARRRLRPPASSCENYGINATYSLIEIATAKVVVTGQTFARVSYDIPGQAQRFARLRGLRDAETRAAKVIAENVRSRFASYFIAGT